MQKVFSIFAKNLSYYNEEYIVDDLTDLPQSIEKIESYNSK